MTRVPRHLRSTLLYLITIVLSQLASFLLLPIISRFLTPGQYGEYVLALTVMSLIGMIGSSWIRNVGFRFYFDAQQAGATRAFYATMATLQVAALAVAFGLGAAILPRVSEELVALPTLLAAGAMVLASDFLALTVSFLRAEKQSGSFAVAEITAAATRLGGTTLGLVLGLTTPAFLFLAAAGASLVGSALALASLARQLTGPVKLDRARLAEVVRRAPAALPYSLGQWVGRLADRLVLNAYASTAVVGIYSAGYNLADRIIGGLSEAVFMMAWPDVLSAFNEGGVERARAAVERYFRLYLWLTVGPLVALAVYGAAVVSILLAPSYQEAVQVLGLVAVAAWIRGLRRGLNRHFELQKRFFPLSAMTVAGSALNLGLNLALVPRYLALGAALATFLEQVVVTFVYLLIRDRRLVAFPFGDLLLVAGFTAALTAGTWLWLGTGVAGFLTFAGSYAVVTAVVWFLRIRRSGAEAG
jgi:O-antigen/teichoic acid export membrane protein